MDVRKITIWGDTANLKYQWGELLSTFEQRTPFLTYEWIETWWQHFGEGKELFILVVEDENEVLAIAPLMLYQERSFIGLPTRILQFIGNFHSNRIDILTSKTKRKEAISAVFQYLISEKWDMLYCLLIPEESPNLPFIRECAQEMGHKIIVLSAATSPFLVLDNSFHSRQNKFRYKVKKSKKGFESIGLIRHETVSGVENLDELLDTVYDIASKGWAYKEHSAICSTPQVRGYYRDLAEKMDELGWFKCELLYLDNKAIAFEYNLYYEGISYLLKLAYDEQYSKHSPGILLQFFVLQQEFSNGTSEYDFLGDADPYKLRWANGARHHLKLFIFNSNFYSKWLHWFPIQCKEITKRVKIF